jgi:hypothetical protein
MFVPRIVHLFPQFSLKKAKPGLIINAILDARN